METDLLVYSQHLTTRFKYICNLILGQLLGIAYNLTDDAEVFSGFGGAKLCYNHQPVYSGDQLLIVPSGLLSEKGINSHQLSFIDYDGSKAFFPVYSKLSPVPFDLLAASFYMVSRYEEYLPYMRDEHGRFSAKSGIAMQQGFLQVPVVNKWAIRLGVLLREQFPALPMSQGEYSFMPTIDVDAAWSIRSKGLVRTIGGYMKDLINLDFTELKSRTQVLLRLKKDPFDTFDLLQSLHEKCRLKPRFFILFADYGLNDKNIPVNNYSFQSLVKSLADYAKVGIHPSYASNDNPAMLPLEIDRLSKVLRSEITISRQHFLKISFPDTYRRLISHDILEDYTLGFAALPGFRAGICSPFKWYDLEAETITDLTLYPFTLMDGTLRDYMDTDAANAMEIIKPLIDQVKAVNGTFISLWHNESVSGEKRWKGWIQVYTDLLAYASDC